MLMNVCIKVSFDFSEQNMQNGCQVAAVAERPENQSPKEPAETSILVKISFEDPLSALTALVKKEQGLKSLKCDIKMCWHSQLTIVLLSWTPAAL